MTSSWWAELLPDAALDQGDIFKDIPFLLPPLEFKGLDHANLKGNAPGFRPVPNPKPDADGRAMFLAQGPVTFGMLLNHGCDIDKAAKKQKLLLALVQPVERLNEANRDSLRSARTIAIMYLPDAPGVGEAYLDFRIVTNLTREFLGRKDRVGTMTDGARARLQVQLIKFFTRRDI